MDKDRRVVIDFTFDGPKSVTFELELGGEKGEGDQRVLSAFQHSVRETMSEMGTRREDARAEKKRGS